MENPVHETRRGASRAPPGSSTAGGVPAGKGQEEMMASNPAKQFLTQLKSDPTLAKSLVHAASTAALTIAKSQGFDLTPDEVRQALSGVSGLSGASQALGGGGGSQAAAPVTGSASSWVGSGSGAATAAATAAAAAA
jgi:hypothetical protein